MESDFHFEEYRSPIRTGWKGWIENSKGKVVAFVKPDGRIVRWEGS